MHEVADEDTLFKIPTRCKRCNREVTDPVGMSFLECTSCNHEIVMEQLFDWLRQQWANATQQQRAKILAWATQLQQGEFPR